MKLQSLLFTALTLVSCAQPLTDASTLQDGVSGEMISLPVCPPNIAAFAPGAQITSNIHNPAHKFVKLDNAAHRYADHGGGVRVHGMAETGVRCANTDQGTTPPIVNQYYNLFLRQPAGADVLLLEMPGHVTHTSNPKVRGQVVMTTYNLNQKAVPAGMVRLVITEKRASGWTEVATISKALPPQWQDMQIWPIEASVAPGAEVRMELRVVFQEQQEWVGDTPVIRIQDARLFGAKCYPDFSNPGQCL